MTSPRGHPLSRSLGNVKAKGSIFPPLMRTVTDTSRNYKDHQLMVHGDGVSRSFGSRATDRDDREAQFSRQSMRPSTSKQEQIGKFLEEIKELQSKEKQQRSKIQTLLKTIEQLKTEIKGKDEAISALNQKLKEIEEHYKLLYEDECKSHDITRQKLNELMSQVEEKIHLIDEMKRKHEETTQKTKDEYESKLTSLEEEKAKEIAERDERIAKMKKQMADVLKGNSQERQQQLEELTKELAKISEEANDLRSKLRAMIKNRTCENCESMKAQVAKRDKKIQEHEGTIKQLMGLCQKFETQLMQQAILKDCVDLVNRH